MYKALEPSPTQSLRARIGDIVLVPARVNGVGIDKRSIRLVIDTKGLPSIRVTNAHGEGTVGYVDPTYVYHAYNRLPSSMLQNLANREPVELLREGFVSLGHSQQQAERYANHATVLVEDFTVPVDMDLSPAASTAEWRNRVEEGNRDWARMCQESETRMKLRQRQMSLLGLEPSMPAFAETELKRHTQGERALPGVMLASGFLE